MHKLVLNLKDRGYTRQQFRRFVRNHCMKAKQFAYDSVPDRKVVFEFESKEEADNCRELLARGLDKLGVENKKRS